VDAAATFDRKRAFADAVAARGRGDRAKAVALFRDVVAHDPSDFETHGKLAQLLAESGDIKSAIDHFRAGAEGYHKKGFTDRAIALLKQAVEAWPLEVDLWLMLSTFYELRLKKKEAAKVLADARPHMKKYPHLAARILDAHLLLEPGAIDLAIDRAFVAKKMGQRGYGILLLSSLCSTDDVVARKRLRRALFSLKKTPASWWRWWKNAKGE
jgi:tetratricopeptide (TPR) repeat protein